MKIRLLCKNLGVIILTNLLMGCASQAINGGAAEAQETKSSESISDTKSVNVNSVPFVSRYQEYLYKILVAEMAFQRGHHALAAKYFLEIAEPTHDPRLAERAARLALYAKDYTTAMTAARLWVTLAPNNPAARQILGEMLFRQERTGEAVEQLEAMLNNTQGDPQQRLEMIAIFLEQQKNQQRALELMEKLVSKRQNEPGALLTYARLLIHVKQFDKALKVLGQILTIAPDHEQAVPLYAHALNEQNKTEQALQWLKAALLKYPNKYQWRLVYARMLANTKQFDKAIQQFELLLSKHPQKADILYALGVLSIQAGRLPAAKQSFMNLLKTGEQMDTAYYYLGQITEMEKNLEQALSWYEKVEGGTNYINAQARIALILVTQGQLEKAIEHLHAVPVESDDDALTLIQFEAELLIDQKRFDQAMATYNRAIVKDPNNTDLLYMRALLAEQLGHIDQLEQDLRQILKIDPNNVHALNALGYSLADLTDRYQEAYELIKKAMELRPDDYYILDSLGWVLYKMGKYNEALTYLRQAQTKQNDPEVAAHLGEVLWVSGKPDQAKQIWKKAQEDFPNDEQLREVIHRFLP
jgi:tetratricopeptide (TPR) repeat protein